MFRLAFWLAVVTAVPACGPPAKPVKHAKHDQPPPGADQLAQARDAVKNGDIDSADQLYAQAYDAGKSFDVLAERVMMLIRAGRAQKAADTAKPYYDANMTEIKGYNLYAEALIAQEKGPDALEVAKQMIGMNAADPSGHDKMGRALLLIDKPDDGLVELRKAVQLAPDDEQYHVSLGTALVKAGKNEDAEAEFRFAIKAAPNDVDAVVSLGSAQRSAGHNDDALATLKKAIELDPRSGRAYFELGLLYNRMDGRQADAEQSLSQAVQLSPNDSLFWYAYGEIFRVSERFDEAINAYKKAVALDPPYPKALTKLGTLLLDKKQYDEAEIVLTQGIRREPKNASNYFPLGKLYAAEKKKAQAIEAFDKFLELAPKTDPDRAIARHDRDALH